MPAPAVHESPQQIFVRYRWLARYWRGDDQFVALEGLWRAANNADVDRMGSFRQYAFMLMRGAVTDFRRELCPVPRRAYKKGARVESAGLMEWVAANVPNPEELLLEKERVLLLRHFVATTFGNEGALLRATLLDREHQEWAKRRRLSKSWASRLNARAEDELARKLRKALP